MTKTKKSTNEDAVVSDAVEPKKLTTNDLEWTDHVLSLLSEDEKISGNPTTDGLRRIFETVMDCTVISAETEIVQSPSIENEKRATAIHHLKFAVNSLPDSCAIKYRSVSGSADVYWGNCDKVYRNHPVAVAETRAEGRALRRALKLRKVVAAEELAKDIEDHPDHDSVTKITNNQINFIDVLGKRLDVDISKLIKNIAPNSSNIYNIEHEKAVGIVQTLTTFQQTNSIPDELKGYSSDWK